MILLDASGLYSALNKAQPFHDPVVRQLERERPPLVLSPFVLAELDYLLLSRGGVAAELAFLDDLAAYELATLDAADVDACRDVIRAYSDIPVGLADASLVVLAGRYGTERVLTLDERHFRALRTPSRQRFTVLPMDEPQ